MEPTATAATSTTTSDTEATTATRERDKSELSPQAQDIDVTARHAGSRVGRLGSHNASASTPRHNGHPPSTPRYNGHPPLFDPASHVYIEGVVTDESCCDAVESHVRPTTRDHANAKLHSTPRINIEECDVSIDSNMFDIVGPQSTGRFPWQKDIGIQCSIIPRVRGRSRSAQGKICSLEWQEPLDTFTAMDCKDLPSAYRHGERKQNKSVSRSEADFFMDHLLDTEDQVERY